MKQTLLITVTRILCFAFLCTHALAAEDDPVRELDWKTLLPANERDSFQGAAPAPAHDYLLGESSDIAAMQSGSFEVNPELEGVRVRVPGFVVPLQSNARGEVNEFFLVPYFGACIHVPPPPNQIIYVKMREGAALRSIEDAQWVTGRLHARTQSSSLGAAAYTLEGELMEPYKY